MSEIDYDPTAPAAKALEALAERLGPDSFAAKLHEVCIAHSKQAHNVALLEAAKPTGVWH